MSNMRVHHHNSLLGHVTMARSGMRTVEDAPTTSTKAKGLAREIFNLLNDLEHDIRTNRIDTPVVEQTCPVPGRRGCSIRKDGTCPAIGCPAPKKLGDPGFTWPACEYCGSRSLRCGCD